MSGLTLRERAEKKLAEASEFELKLENVEASADDINRLETLANEAGELFRQVQSQAQASGTIKEANEFFRSVGLNGPAEDGETAKMQAMSGQSGISLPTGGMSMGDAFLTSPAYQEMLKFTDAGGSSLSDQWAGTSPKYSVPEQAIDQNGMIQNALITSPDVSVGTGGVPIVEPTTLAAIDKDPLRRTWMRQKANVIQVSGVGFKYPVLTSRTNNAGFVAESTSTADGLPEDAANGYKPESALDWDVETGTVETIAHWVPMTRQSIVIAPQVRSTVETFLRQGILVAEEIGFLQGNGTSPQLRGLYNTAQPYNNIFNVSVGGGNRFNAILAAMGLVSQANEGAFNPDCIVINPIDWNSPEFLGSVDANGNWQFGGPAAAPANLNPWGLTPIITEAQPAGTQLIGDFRYMLIADASPIQVFFADQHKDWFRRNLVLILAERMVGFAIQCEEAFATITA